MSGAEIPDGYPIATHDEERDGEVVVVEWRTGYHHDDDPLPVQIEALKRERDELLAERAEARLWARALAMLQRYGVWAGSQWDLLPEPTWLTKLDHH